jgi:ComF family protein
MKKTLVSPMDLQRGVTGAVTNNLLNLLFPNHCHFCGMLLSSGVCICASCSAMLEIIEESTCHRCGAPLQKDAKPEADICSQCRDLNFVFIRNVSLGIFDGVFRKLIHLYKFDGRRSLHHLFAHALYMNHRTYIEEADCIVHVPLTASRYAERGFNQSSLLAKRLAYLSHGVYMGSALRRTGSAAPQSNMTSRVERITNITDRFTVRSRCGSGIENKAILLIDDVLTTGATASACASALMDAHADCVKVLTIARSVKREPGLYLSPNRPIMK